MHPRPDERHITYDDVIGIREVITTEYNIEGFPDERYIEIIKKVKPMQATLVPDPPDVLTSNAGWDTVKQASFLKEVILEIKNHASRVSIFSDTRKIMIEGAAQAERSGKFGCINIRSHCFLPVRMIPVGIRFGV